MDWLSEKILHILEVLGAAIVGTAGTLIAFVRRVDRLESDYKDHKADALKLQDEYDRHIYDSNGKWVEVTTLRTRVEANEDARQRQEELQDQRHKENLELMGELRKDMKALTRTVVGAVGRRFTDREAGE